MILRVPSTGLITDPNYLGGRYLDTVNDPVCGGQASMGTGAAPRLGQLGNIINLGMNDAAKLGKNITLYAGSYMYVKFKSGSTAANAQGRLVFWDTLGNSGHTGYVVTPDAAVAGQFVAGVALYAVTKGYFGWIQIRGLANVLCAATLVDNTLGDIAFVEIALTGAVGAADFNTKASVTAAQQAAKFGEAYQQPVAASSKLVWLY